MMRDDIEILAANHAALYGSHAHLIIDEIIRKHASNAEWDEVTRWNRVKIRISRRKPPATDPGAASFSNDC